MSTARKKQTQNSGSVTRKLQWIRYAAALLWICLLIWAFFHRQDFSLDTLLQVHPRSLFLTAILMLGLFALKSMSFFFYAGFLYLADGILFPFPLACLISLLGAWIMVSLPYGFGRWLGADACQELLERYPKLKRLDAFLSDNLFVSIILVRVIGRMPSDLVSLYFGVRQSPYSIYMPASLLCCIPHILTYPIMGQQIENPGSPAFLLALGFEIVWASGCLVGYFIYKKHHPSAGR